MGFWDEIAAKLGGVQLADGRVLTGTGSYVNPDYKPSALDAGWKTQPPTQQMAQPVGFKPQQNMAATTADAARAKREAQMQAFTGWDNDPQVRSLQMATWAIYVDTGKWNTAEQQQLHAQAEKIRKYNNPTYGGLPFGPIDWMDAEKITPRDTTPGANTIEGGLDSVLNPDKFGSYVKAGAGVLFVVFILSMFRK